MSVCRADANVCCCLCLRAFSKRLKNHACNLHYDATPCIAPAYRLCETLMHLNRCIWIYLDRCAFYNGALKSVRFSH